MIDGIGLTVMLKFFGDPKQVVPPKVICGVTVINPTIGATPLFVVANDGILPEPDAAKPIAVFEFVQL